MFKNIDEMEKQARDSGSAHFTHKGSESLILFKQQEDMFLYFVWVNKSRVQMARETFSQRLFGKG